MFGFNLVGNLTKDAEAKKVGEKWVIGLSIAVNRKKKNGDNIVSYINVAYWCSSNKVAQYLTKGKKIACSGSWYENKEGNDNRYYQTFYANEIEFGFDKSENSNNSRPAEQGNTFAGADDDDLPF